MAPMDPIPDVHEGPHQVWTERERRALRESSGRPRFRLPCQAGPHRPDRRFRRRPTEQERLRAKLHKARGEEE